MTVFLGPNEAGKSTLLGFLRGVLFGFPGRRSRASQYPPLKGGRHGGRVTLSGPQGDVIVERVVSTRNGLLVNGNEATGQDLQTLLGGADAHLFCSVFAFSLTEIQSFEWLQAEQIRERIFSAGIAGAGASARQVIDKLEADAAQLFRTRGGSRVKELNERIEEAERRRKVAETNAERYVSLEAEQERRALRVAELSEHVEELRQKQRPLEKLLELWTERERAREELSALDPVDEFPNDPEARLAALAGKVDAARAVANRLQNEKSAAELARAKLTAAIDEKLTEIWDRVEELYSRLALHRQHVNEFESTPREPDLKSRLAIRALFVLGAGIALGAGWLTGRGQVYSGLLTLLVGLIAAGFVVYRRAARAAGIARLEKQIAEWEEPVSAWTASCSKGNRLVLEFLEFRERCRKDREMRAKLAAFEEGGVAMQSKLEASERGLAAAEDELREFLRQAGAANEREFQSRLEVFRKRQELRARIVEWEQRLSFHSPDEWKTEAARLAGAIVRSETERDEAIGEQHLRREQLARIAESAALPAVRAELEWLHAERAQALREWRVTKLAQELVERTLQEFTQTRQPAVLEEASEAFARITNGIYPRITQDDAAAGLIIWDHTGGARGPEELSRGSAEQLYLCLRLALASEFARRAESLPLIMDDVLVNFDPERARAVAIELARFSERRQILIFTCHPETARLLAEVSPGAAVIPMERYGQSAAQ